MQTGHDECMSSIVPGGQAGSVVLGSNFMRHYFSAFYAATAEQATSRIALAKAMPSPDAAGVHSLQHLSNICPASRLPLLGVLPSCCMCSLPAQCVP